MTTATQSDFVFANHGSLWICQPTTTAAEEHLDEHLGDEAQRWGGGVAVDPRYVESLASTLVDAGFTVEAV